MDIAAFLLATAIAHAGFAVFVTAHARLTGQPAGNMAVHYARPRVSVGLAGYFFYDEIDGSI